MKQKEIKSVILFGLMNLRQDQLYHHVSEILVPLGVNLTSDEAFQISKRLIDDGLVEGLTRGIDGYMIRLTLGNSD